LIVYRNEAKQAVAAPSPTSLYAQQRKSGDRWKHAELDADIHTRTHMIKTKSLARGPVRNVHLVVKTGAACMHQSVVRPFTFETSKICLGLHLLYLFACMHNIRRALWRRLKMSVIGDGFEVHLLQSTMYERTRK
jgi:hypothetical protein